MEFISSDTNIWIDFKVINRLTPPFLLPYKYIMFVYSMTSELLNPKGFKEELEMHVYRNRTNYRIALAIAKQRNITLLTGDKALRIAAKKENVDVIGTIGILDKLVNENFIDYDEFIYCISSLLKHNGREVRLPQDELIKRIGDNKNNFL